MVERTEVIKAVRNIIVVLIIIALLVIFRGQVFPFFRGEELTSDVQAKVENDFDSFAENVEACRDLNKTNCLCEGFPTWPGAFPSESTLTIKEVGKKAELNLNYGKQMLKNTSIENIKINAMFPDKKKLEYKAEKSVSFKQEPPLWIQEGETGFFRREKSVVSSYLYKEKDAIYFIINYGKELAKIEDQISMCI